MLFLLCLLFDAPGVFQLPPIDRDESRFAQASRGIAEAGDWEGVLVPVFDDRPRLNKPPLIYWFQAISHRAMESVMPSGSVESNPRKAPWCDETRKETLPKAGIAGFRLPSVVSAALAALITWRIGVSMFGPPVGWLAGLLLGSCLLVCVDARQARADQLLLMFTVLAQFLLWRIWQRSRGPAHFRRSLDVVAFWCVVGLGIMTKGPVTPAVSGLTVFSLCLLGRDWQLLRTLRPLLGLGILAAIVLPWPIAVSSVVGWERMSHVIMDEVLGRSISSKEGHSAPPGYHLLLLPVLFWPGSLALLPGLMRGFARGLRWAPAARGEPSDRANSLLSRFAARFPHVHHEAEAFCIAWIVPTWVLFELVATKLPHYVLPTYPAIALLCARALFDCRGRWREIRSSWGGRTALWGWFALTVVLALGIPTFLGFSAWPATGLAARSWTILAPAAGLVLMVLLFRRLREGRVRRAAAPALASCLLLSATTFAVLLPRMPFVWLSSQAVRAYCAHDGGTGRPFGAVGYAEDSLVFLTHGFVDRLSWGAVPKWCEEHPGGLLLTSEHPAGFVQRPDDCLSEFTPIWQAEGVQYAKGRWVGIELLDRTPPAESSPNNPD